MPAQIYSYKINHTTENKYYAYKLFPLYFFKLIHINTKVGRLSLPAQKEPYSTEPCISAV
jgi:hypothetical protein